MQTFDQKSTILYNLSNLYWKRNLSCFRIVSNIIICKCKELVTRKITFYQNDFSEIFNLCELNILFKAWNKKKIIANFEFNFTIQISRLKIIV